MKQRKASNCTKVNIKQHTIKAFSLTFHLFITSCLKSFAFSCFFFLLLFLCLYGWLNNFPCLGVPHDELSGEGVVLRGWVHCFHGTVPRDLQTEKLPRLPASSRHKTQTLDFRHREALGLFLRSWQLLCCSFRCNILTSWTDMMVTCGRWNACCKSLPGCILHLLLLGFLM